MLGLALAACGGPSTETKRLVARCVQEPARVVRDLYARSYSETGPPTAVPVVEVMKRAVSKRSSDLEQLSTRHRVLVESKMTEFTAWLAAHTRFTHSVPPRLPGQRAMGQTYVEFADNDELNAKGESLCIEAFGDW